MSAVAEDHLRSFVERILRLKEEQDTIGADVRDVYAEAKSAGYDKTAMGKLVAEIRAKQKNGARVDELDAILDLYRAAYHGRASVGTPPATHRRAGEEA